MLMVGVGTFLLLTAFSFLMFVRFAKNSDDIEEL